MTAGLSAYRFSHDAMDATFEIFVRGQSEDYARQAAHAAFEELDRLGAELSRFIESSDVSRINRLRAGEAARVGIATLECLLSAKRIHAETNGAFDVTIASLLACWQSGGQPTEEELAAARARTDIGLLRINQAEHTVAPAADGVKVDLGGIGKGYAVDQMAALLREWSIGEALIHAGESTALAMGRWSVSIRDPERQSEILGRVHLQDRAVSGSGVLLRGSHIINPRTGRPVEDKLGAWAAAPLAAASDALSTAFMVMSPSEVGECCRRNSEVSALLAIGDAGGRTLMRFGEWEVEIKK